MVQGYPQSTQTTLSPKEVYERMTQAANRHDLEAMLTYFAPDYRSEQPFHPERDFTGPEGVRKNWSFFFATMPDFQAETLSTVEAGDAVWAEMHMHGTQADGTKVSTRGVTLMRIHADRIVWARLYIETTQEPG